MLLNVFFAFLLWEIIHIIIKIYKIYNKIILRINEKMLYKMLDISTFITRRKIVKENRNARNRRTHPLPFLNSSVSSITWLVMAASKVGVRGGQWPVRVIGWPPRTCHERVAVRGDGVQRETEIERVTQGIGVLESAWKLRLHGRATGRKGCRRRIWRGCEKAS